jgi:hypothetical protein
MWKVFCHLLLYEYFRLKIYRKLLHFCAIFLYLCSWSRSRVMLLVRLTVLSLAEKNS